MRWRLVTPRTWLHFLNLPCIASISSKHYCLGGPTPTCTGVYLPGHHNSVFCHILPWKRATIKAVRGPTKSTLLTTGLSQAQTGAHVRWETTDRGFFKEMTNLRSPASCHLHFLGLLECSRGLQAPSLAKAAIPNTTVQLRQGGVEKHHC